MKVSKVSRDTCRDGAGIEPGPGHRVVLGISSYKKMSAKRNMFLYYSRWLYLSGSNLFMIYAA